MTWTPGPLHQAYPPIVAASRRAAKLHCCCIDREFTWGPVKPHDRLNRGAWHTILHPKAVRASGTP
ncbi:hypothetical protein EV702DRAFT_1114334 [Suillus placidus]|uniref:Uncharacterized protein n=1 Tax=Suillus placidus TaxID=48579 RepID=A0A9P6ZS37_9AGAM|nr:hypothetical protein EV702DRAFT_1114334 [Suillus placidus]